MSRPLILVLIFALAFMNGAAVAAAICQHQDGRDHALARASSDQRVAAQAVSEEAAAATTSKKAAVSDAAATWLAGHGMPSDPPTFPLMRAETIRSVGDGAAKLASRTVPPLREPPLA